MRECFLRRRVRGAWAIEFTADGARLASGMGDGAIDVFEATTGRWLRSIGKKGVGHCLHRMSFSPTAISMLATVTVHDTIRVWDIDCGEMVREIEGCCKVAIFSPDGRTIATVSAGSSRDVQLIDAESGEVRYKMVGHTSAVYTTSWCPYDGSKLASAGEDGTCKVWDSSTGELICSITIGRRVASMVWGRDWVRDTGAMAFAMGHHPRVGAESRVLELEVGVVQMILDRV